MHKLKKYLPAGSFGISLLLHLVIFVSISGVILIEAVSPKIPFVAVNSGSEVVDLVEPPEIPEEQANVDNLPVEEVQPSGASFEVEQISSAVTSAVPTWNIAPSLPTGLVGTGQGGQAPGGTQGKRGGTPGPRVMTNPFGGDTAGDSSALTGYMYDLKQTFDRRPSDMAGKEKGADGVDLKDPANGRYEDFVTRFISSGWNRQLLEKYYKVERPLGIYQLFIPRRSAASAPAAFKAEQEVQPRRWVILYQGSFVAPDSGSYRFVGIGDDVLAVRLGGKTVLDASLFPISKVRRELVGSAGTAGRPLFGGEWFSLRKGESYPLEVLLGECPGGSFFAFLLIENKNTKYASRGDKLGSLLPVFQLAPTNMPNYNPEQDGPAVAKEAFTCQ